ncbi:glycosyltransferase [Psychrobacter sp. I-STPA6b]|uniref:glycosyltransferase n=1 Tax=Psychrobacter sp. I-STPA6b TaxID=2585718 RepID=UPI001D0CA17D|nr:glycosyltransferase [Psychrobacter sp. I-STPA6b]
MLSQPNILKSESNNILFSYHRLDCIGGIETRLIDEFDYLQRQNFQVFFLTNKNRCDPQVCEIFSHCQFITIDIDNISYAPDFIKLVDSTINAIEIHGITLVSIHALDLFTLATVMAAQICKVPVIATVHGVIDIYRQPFYQILIQQFTNKSFSQLIFVSKTTQNLGAHIGSCQSYLIPNLINLDKYQFHNQDEQNGWLIVSRISHEKFPSIMAFLKAAETCNINKVSIAGGGNPEALQQRIIQANITITIEFLGERTDIATLIPQYEGIAGMARVALEGLACKKPVCIISPEGTLKGLVMPNNFMRLKDYNFTGKSLLTISENDFVNQLQNLRPKDIQTNYELLNQHLSTKKWLEYIPIYKKASFIDNPELEALYHKIAYYAPMLQTPFEKDEFFHQLFIETLRQFELKEVENSWWLHKQDNDLFKSYPSPFSPRKKEKFYKKLLK